MKFTNIWSRCLRLALLLALIFGTFTLSALAVEWDLTDGTLTVSGEEYIPDNFAEEELADKLDQIQRIVLTEGITGIGYESFLGCTNLTEVLLPETLEYVGSYCFNECPQLTRFEFPASVSDIEDSVFYCEDGSKLTTVLFRGVPNYISDYAFEGVTANVFYPSDSEWSKDMMLDYEGTLTWLPIIASGTCGENATWTLAGTTLTISGTGAIADYSGSTPAPWDEYRDTITQVIVEEGITGIGNFAFRYMTALTHVTLPESLRFIGSNAFLNCTSLTGIDLPSNLVTIYDHAFYESGLTSIIIPDSVTSLGNHVFYGCVDLISCTLPSNLEYISHASFYFCSKLESIHIPASVKSIYYAFYECNSLKTVYIDDLEKWCSINFNDGMPVGYTLCLNGEPVVDLVVPDSITELPPYLFSNCTSIKSLTAPTVQMIGYNAFDGCTALETVHFSDTLTHLGAGSFLNCKSLKTLHLPASVGYIDGAVFERSGLTELYFNGTAPSLAGDFIERLENLKIYYPENDSTWDEVANKPYGAIDPQWIPHQVSTPGSTPETAIAMEPDKSYTAAIPTGAQSLPVYNKFTLTEKGLVSLYINKPMGTPDNLTAEVTICDENGNELLKHTPKKTNESLQYEIHTGLAAGTYCLNFSVTNKTGSNVQMEYTYSFDSTDTEIESNNSTDAASPLLDGISLIGHIATGDEDYFSMTLEKPSTVTLSISELNIGADTYTLNLLSEGAEPKPLSMEDFTNSDGVYTMNLQLAAGTHYLHFNATAQSQLVYHICASYIEQCTHENVVTDAAVPATCTTPGLTEGNHCGDCGAVLTPQETAPTLDHTPGELTDKVTPTCLEDGYTGDIYCTVCDTLITEGETDPATGHTLVTINQIKATCVSQGYTGDEVCQKCNDYEVKYGEKIPMADHKWSEWVKVFPTFTHSGFAQRSCSVCKQIEEQTIPKLEQENPFVDVKEDAWYHDSVLWAARNDITTGTDATHFSPDAICTRGQVVTFLWRAMTEQPKSHGANPFQDIASTDYFYDAVLWAAKNDITTGTSDTAFSPALSCTRGQVVTFLWRASGCPNPGARNSFSDVPAGTWYSDAVIWAKASGITDGTGNGLFSPNAECTRAQIVTFLCRWMAPSES